MVGKSLSHYKILEELGRGGMGIVYKAEDTKLDRTVAIKVLPSAALASEDDRARFYREAKAAAQLHHQHIASVFEIDEAVLEGANTDDSWQFIAVEFIEDETLESRIKEGRLKLKGAVRIASLMLLLAASTMQATVSQSLHPRLLDPGTATDLSRVMANDNRTPAGALNNDVLELNLDIGWADWRIETADGPGLRVVALAESGKAPTVPGPLIRVDTGTRIHVQIRNTLTDSTITVFGLQSRPAEKTDSLVVEPGDTKKVEFEAGEPGMYFYWIRLGADIPIEEGEEEQLAGAFIIDPNGRAPPDRVFVINIFSTSIDTTAHAYGWLEALTINGLSQSVHDQPSAIRCAGGSLMPLVVIIRCTYTVSFMRLFREGRCSKTPCMNQRIDGRS